MSNITENSWKLHVRAAVLTWQAPATRSFRTTKKILRAYKQCRVHTVQRMLGLGLTATQLCQPLVTNLVTITCEHLTQLHQQQLAQTATTGVFLPSPRLLCVQAVLRTFGQHLFSLLPPPQQQLSVTVCAIQQHCHYTYWWSLYAPAACNSNVFFTAYKRDKLWPVHTK